jgi:hypothetical protein
LREGKRQKTSHDPVQPGHGVEGQLVFLQSTPVHLIETGLRAAPHQTRMLMLHKKRTGITYEARQIVLALPIETWIQELWKAHSL